MKSLPDRYLKIDIDYGLKYQPDNHYNSILDVLQRRKQLIIDEELLDQQERLANCAFRMKFKNPGYEIKRSKKKDKDGDEIIEVVETENEVTESDVDTASQSK